MAQLNVQHDVVDSPMLREHIEKNVADIETVLPDGTSVIVSLKRVSRTLFSADLRTKGFKRSLIVSEQDTNLFQALSRAKRLLMRQIEEVQKMERDRRRGRHMRHALTLANAEGW